MASGEFIASISPAEPTGTDYATFDTIEGGSTVPERIGVYDFSGSDEEFMDFACVLLPQYDGGGLTLRIIWSASVGFANHTVWQAAIRRVADDAENLNTSHNYSYQIVEAAAPSAVGEVSYDEITFTDGEQMDDLEAGEKFILRIKRDPAHPNDDMAGDAELHAQDLLIKET